MKTNIFLLFIAMLFVSCANTPQETAEKRVKKHLKKTTQVYEPVSFGKLDTINLIKVPEYIMAKDSLEYNKAELKKTNNQFVLAGHQQAAKKFKIIMDDMADFYKNKKYGIKHTFKTAEGEKEQVFYLNSIFEVVE